MSCTPWLKDIAKGWAPLYCGYRPCALYTLYLYCVVSFRTIAHCRSRYIYQVRRRWQLMRWMMMHLHCSWPDWCKQAATLPVMYQSVLPHLLLLLLVVWKLHLLITVRLTHCKNKELPAAFISCLCTCVCLWHLCARYLFDINGIKELEAGPEELFYFLALIT